MHNPRNQKLRLICGSLILTQIFIALPWVIVQFIAWGLIEKLMFKLENYGEWIVFIIAIPWIALTVALIFIGRKIGPKVLSRFYTRDEMHEILAGPFAPRPLNPRKKTSINRELEYLYK